MKGRTPYTACPLCSGDFTEHRREPCDKHALWRDVIAPEMVWMRCAGCGHVFTDGHFTPEAQAVIFKDTNESQQVGYLIEDQRLICGRMVERVPVRAGTWLDVGFGSGSLMFAAEEAGFAVEGIDLRAESVETMQQLGYAVACAELHQLEPVQREVISLCDVLEHVPFPGDLLAEARARGRVLLLSCPNAGSMAWKALSGAGQNPYWSEIEHFHNFTRERLEKLLRQTGWEPRAFSVSERYRLGMEIVAE